MANKRPRRYIFVFILILLLGSTGIFLTKTDAGFTIVYRIVQRTLDRQYGLDLSIESISSRMRTNIQADKLEFANADSTFIIKVDTIDINYSGIFELLGRGHLDSLTLIEPDICIFLDKGNTGSESIDFSEIDFPNFLIQHIRVERAKVHIHASDTLVYQEIDELQCHYSGSEEGVKLRIDKFELENKSLDLKISQFNSEISIKNNIAKLRDLTFNLNDTRVTSNGKIRYIDPLRFKLHFNVRNLRAEEYIELPVVDANDVFNMQGDIQGDLKEITALVTMDGFLNNQKIEESIFNLEYKDNYVHVLDAEFRNEDNDLSLYGSYGLEDKYLNASIIPRKLRPSDWIKDIPEFDLQGHLRASGYLDKSIKLNYDMDINELYDIDNANFAGNIEIIELEDIKIDSTNRLSVFDGLLTYSGKIDDFQELDLNIRGDINRISGINIPDVPSFSADTMIMTLNIRGEIADPDIEMNFNLDSLKYDDISTQNLNVSLFSKNTVSQPGGALLISTEEVVIDSFEFGDVQTYVHMQEDFIELDYLDVVHEDYNLSLSGTVDDYREFKINKMQGVYQDEEVYLLEPVTFNIQEDRYSLSRFDVLYRDALLFGSFDVKGDSLMGSVNIAGAELNSLPLLSTLVDSLTGVLDMNIDINGSMDDPNIDLGMQLKRAHAFGLDLKRMRSEMHYKDSLVNIDYFKMQIDDERRIDLKGEMPLFIDFNNKNIVGLLPKDSVYAELELEKVRLEKLLPFVLPFLHIVGETDANGIITGTINDPIMNAELVAYDPEIELILADSITSNFHYSNERMFFDDVEIFANNGYFEGNANMYMDLRVQTDQERHQPDSSVYAYIKGYDDEMIFLTPFIGAMESLTGNVKGELEIVGNFNESSKNGKLLIDDGTLVIDILGNEIKNISGEGIITDNIADVHLRGLLPSETYSFANILGFEKTDSNFTVDGTLDLANLISPRFDIDLVGEQLSIVTLDDNVNLTTGLVDLQVTGQDTLTITGDVTIQEGSIEYGFSPSAPTEALAPSDYDGIKMAYSINAMIDKTYFRNQLLDVTLNGEMLLQKFPNESNTRMGGELQVTEGFFNYWASVFYLEQGSSLILDQFEGNHQLNFTATKEVSTDDQLYTIIAAITGELNNPQISFNDDVGALSQAEIVRLLTVGEIENVIDDLVGGGGGGTFEAEGITNALLSLAEVPLEQQARSFGARGGLDRLDIVAGQDGGYITNSDGRTVLDETTALVIGGRIGRNFYLTYEASQANLLNMEFEYRLNNKLSIVGAADETKVEGAVRLRLQY